MKIVRYGSHWELVNDSGGFVSRSTYFSRTDSCLRSARNIAAKLGITMINTLGS